MTREERIERIERCLRGIANDGCGDMDSHRRTCRDRSDDPSAWCWACVAAAEIEAVDASPSPGNEGAREEPPPVCTGSWHGVGEQVFGSGLIGRCGICRREVPLVWNGLGSVCGTHPYRPAPRASVQGAEGEG